jgi:hypothetical protein
MNDPSNEVVNVFYDALQGKTTLPVYSMVPSKIDNFIVIGDYTGVEDSAKDTWITDATIQIEFVKRYTGQGTKSEVNADVNTVIGIVRAAFGTTLTMSGFNMTVSTIESTTDFVEEDDEFKIYRKFITVRLIIEQT